MSGGELAKVGFSDAAMRASDAMNTAVLAGQAGKWLAIKLHDGSTDGTAYDQKADAVRFQLHEQMCMYLKVPHDGLQPREAQRLLDIHRQLYDAGFRLSDPDQVLGLPLGREDVTAWR